jgi:putative transposase
LGGESRAGYYRHFGHHPPKRDDADLRDLIQRIALDNRHYGYRRIAHELRRSGLFVNDKRVRRLTREDNLLSQRVTPFVPTTTMSRHDFPIVPNLTRRLVPTGVDQIWVADITYVRLSEGFVYLAAILDAFSRKVVGWAIADHLEASLTIEALDMALAARNPPPMSLIHHSASMSRVGNPYDNAKAESFMKTLKSEEVDAKTTSTSTTPAVRSAPSSKPSTTPAASTRRSATNPRPNSKPKSAGITVTTQTRTKPCP